MLERVPENAAMMLTSSKINIKLVVLSITIIFIVDNVLFASFKHLNELFLI